MTHKIALLATGDEIIQGDILNTNSQRIAQMLSDHCFEVGFHMTAPDGDAPTLEALQLLLATHQAVIITGGLGPTSDDRTRFALATAIQEPLVLDETVWQSIVDRLTQYGLSVPESNKQQALFPENATIIPNQRGTAAGCYLKYQDKLIFMLPGPPVECLPMVTDVVLPVLLKTFPQHHRVLRKWRLFGVSEGHVAAELEEALAKYNLVTGYRIDYPYIEFKVSVQKEHASETLWTYIDSLVKPYLLGNDAHQSASQRLITALKSYEGGFAIEDHVTGGRLATAILHPSTQHALYFGDLSAAPDTYIPVRLEGLDAFWQEDTSKKTTTLTVTWMQKEKQETLSFSFPLRPQRMLAHTVEFITQLLFDKLSEISS